MKNNEKKIDIGVTVKKDENFSEWYTQVVLKSGLAEYSSIKGFMVIKPWGYAIWEMIQKVIDREIKKRGVKNVYFPLMIPKSILSKEEEHIEGFSAEVAWVTKGGNKELDEPLAIRPTSETIIYDTFTRWIRSWRDLPILINQWCGVVRWETKSTKLFIRTREFLWQEGHTAHETKEEAEEMVMDILINVYKKIIEEYLAIASIAGKKTESEKFAGALYTTTLEALMPDKKALQMATSHNLGQNFSKAYGIKYMDRDEKEKYVWQTSWGISTRTMGALVMVHGDDKGLVLPPKIAPLQVVVIPILFEKTKKRIIEEARRIKEELEKQNIRVEVDERDHVSAGFKFNDWDLKGVPLKIEIGPRDLERNEIVIVRRDTLKKETIKRNELIDKVKKNLEDIQKALYEKSKRYLEDHIIEVNSYEELKEIMNEKRGMAYGWWCGSNECESKIKEETGATSRCIPFALDNKPEKQHRENKCIVCGKRAKYKVLFARAY